MNEKHIIELYQKRDEQALSQTQSTYGAYCRKIAYNILNDIRDVEECINDAYLKVWNLIPPNAPNNLAAYIGRIVRTTSFDLYRKQRAQRRDKNKTDLILEELSECCGSSVDGPEQILEERELRRVINQYLENLDAPARDIFIKRYWYAYSLKDISKILDMNESTVKSKLYLTRKKLKEHLIEEGLVE